MTLVLKNPEAGKSCQMDATKEHIEFLKNFGVMVDTDDNKATAYVSKPISVMAHLKKMCS